MIINEHENVQLGKVFGENFYFNRRTLIRSNYTQNNINVNCWNIDATQKVFSVEHEYYNEFYKKHNDNEYFTKNNYTDTRQTVLYYITYEELPYEIQKDDSGTVYNGSVRDSFVNDIIKQIEKVAKVYKYADIKVISNVLKYRSEESIKNDIIQQRIETMNNNRISYDPMYDMRVMKDVLCVYTNNVSFLFVHCNSMGIPVVLSKDLDYVVYDKYVYDKFNKITDKEFKMYSNEEFIVMEMDVDNDEFVVEEKYRTIKREVEQKIVEETTRSTFKKLYFYKDALIIKDLFNTSENNKLINIVENLEEIDNETLIVTLNNKLPYNNYLRKNQDKRFKWLGFDFDIIRNDSNENSIRYYMQSFGNVKPMYDFVTVKDIQHTYNIKNIKDTVLNEDGKIILCLDYPVGINYQSKKIWFEKWKEVIDKLKSKFNNTIVCKTYFDDKERKIITKEVFDKYFGKLDNVEYDNSEVSFIEKIRQDDVYFCVKRQGALYLKCYLNGKILLTGLTIKERESKPDRMMFMNLESALDDVVEGKENLTNIVKKNNEERLSIMKSSTNNLTKINDIKNGTFVKKIVLN